ncbi:hypothetical protein RS130_01970 [Paraglaciecola aquimarina]|uniref:Uncharacterized protein n=1 Tax=Paraglaciecola aquimarina TaxID=1235557 RepID=A0ABU3SSA1_9ALTE|nr:hypothetical protein [Paraglaciecola aquimarina]MDU0352852.1 hypothetical protein [Paraglaciecola aquimarina]
MSKPEHNVVPDGKSEAESNSFPAKTSLIWILSALLALSVIVNIWGQLTSDKVGPSQYNVLRQHSLWQPLFTNHKPTLIVIGDLYFLSELDSDTKLVRAIREYSVNNDNDLQNYLTKYPQKQDVINKAGSAFILKNSVFALQHILPLFEQDKPATIKLASELSPADLRDFNLIYIGLYKSLGLLDAYFQGSNFRLKKNTPALFHKTTDKVYRITGQLHQEYTDYGSFAKFKGPSGNQVYLFAGFSDASIIQMAKYLTNVDKLNSAEFVTYYPQGESLKTGFELIFSASSFDRTDLDSNIVDSGTLDHKAIWSMPL